MYIRRLLLGATAMTLCAPAWAGEEPLYQPPPTWVKPADIAAAAAKAKGPMVLFDRQMRIEGDGVSAYVDSAVRLDSPQALTQFGTLSTAWLPDKGDLTIHRAELLRAGDAIDLLKSGTKFTVLRREQQLEQRELDGMLTATMPVAGAQLGDIVRLSFSVSEADAALGGDVQRIDTLPAQPFDVGLSRLSITWPAKRGVRVAGRPGLELPAPETRGGETRLEIPLPLAKQREIPEDAPARYRIPAQVQLTSFEGWEDVSSTFARLFSGENTITPGGPLAAEVARIAASSSDPEAQIEQALRLVQDKVSYLANGLNGGNYVPQAPEKTWETRYGDCKAKTLLLLAILQSLGVQGHAVLVNATAGDAVEDSLPMAAAFNHVLVRAQSGGRDYWLDGTSGGSSRATLGEVPPFRFGLPLLAQGSTLIPLVQTTPAAPQFTVRTAIDQTAGIDFPVLFDTRVTFHGEMAAGLRPLTDVAPGEQRDNAIDGMIAGLLGEVQIARRTIVADGKAGTVTITAAGIQTSGWDRSERRAALTLNLPSSQFSFKPDRGRAAWREIPVDLGSAGRLRTDIEFKLPEAGREIVLENGNFQGESAGTRIERSARIDGAQLIVTEETSTTGGVLQPSQLAAARAGAAAQKNASLRLRAPSNPLRQWQIATPAQRKTLKPIEEMYATLIANDPDDASNYVNRASFLGGIGDHAAALKDYDKALKLDASAQTFDRRAGAYQNIGDLTRAITDLTEAEAIAPSPQRAATIAQLLGMDGRADEGLLLIEGALENAGDAKVDLVATRAELLARLDRKSDGLAALDEMLADRPGDSAILNARCWYRGVWNFALEAALADCNKAVEAATWTPPVLDSRALVHLRLGNLETALADASAALERSGGQTQTLMLRGIIREKLGNPLGKVDIGEALRRRPGLKQEYREYGLLP